MKPIDKTAAFVVVAAIATGVWAHGALAGEATSAQSSTSVSSGGVSVNSRDQLRSNTPPHNVKMVFSLTTGNYLSDVAVKVTDSARRTVVDDVSNGPWLFAQLPPGTYTATATYNGKSVTQRISLAKSGVRTVQFRWPASVEESADAGERILGTGPQESQR
jgi:hypothetical protein